MQQKMVIIVKHNRREKKGKVTKRYKNRFWFWGSDWKARLKPKTDFWGRLVKCCWWSEWRVEMVPLGKLSKMKKMTKSTSSSWRWKQTPLATLSLSLPCTLLVHTLLVHYLFTVVHGCSWRWEITSDTTTSCNKSKGNGGRGTEETEGWRVNEERKESEDEDEDDGTNMQKADSVLYPLSD